MDRPVAHDSADARLIAARRYLATIPVAEDYAEQLAVHLGGGAAQREQLRALLLAECERMESVHVALMVKHLTAPEIEALTQFQASPAGRRIMQKMGAFQVELIPALTPLLRGVVEEAQRTPPPAEPERP